MAKPIIAIVGRPNVGKSTLFNKLVGQRLSIVKDTPGVTRDRIYSPCEWRGKEVMLVDTGGIEPYSNDVILSQMRRQAQLAIESADVIVLVTDLRTGVTANDQEVASMPVSYTHLDVYKRQLESTPEMNMPTMTIMTSYPDASPDEVDEMVTQKIESALSGITEVESMTSTSSEGSSMIMLEFGCDVDTDDKYQDITSALAMVQLPEDCSDPNVMQMDSSSMNSSILNISISTTDADNAVAYVEDNICLLYTSRCV